MSKLTKTIISIFVMMLGLITTSTVTFAESEQSPEDILSKNTFVLITVDPNELKAPLKGYYGTIIEEFFLPEIFGIWDSNAPESEPWNLLKTQLSSTTKVSLAIKVLPSGEAGVLFIEMPEDEFTTNIKDTYLTGTELSVESDVQIYRPTVYEPTAGYDPNLTFAYFQGYLLIGDSEETLKTVISEYGTDPLSSSAQFTKVNSNLSSTGAVTVFVNVVDVMAEFLTEEEATASTLAFLSAGISIDQETSGLKFKLYTVMDPDKIKALGLDFDTASPLSLYKYMPKENPLYFVDDSKWSTVISMIQALPEYGQAATALEASTSINLDNLLSGFEKELAILVRDNGELFPSLTFMSDTGDNTEIVNAEINKGLEMLWEALKAEATADSTTNNLIFDSEEGTATVTKNTVQIGESDVTQYSIEFAQKGSKNPYAMTLPEDLLNFKITVGTTSDNVLLVSTDKAIESAYKGGLQNNSIVESLISDKIDGLCILEIKNINTYLQNTLSKLKESFPTEMENVETFKTYIDTILKAWDFAASTSIIKNDSSEITAELKVDLEQAITDMETIISNFAALEGEHLEQVVMNSNTEFNDVEAADWYGNNVYYLSTEGIINGYEDGSYKPNQNINRAEFVTLIVTILEDKGYIEQDPLVINYCPNCPLLFGFKDVKEEDWYADHLGKAVEAGIIKGYEDETFRPNQPISRAEAAQILANILTGYDLLKSLPGESEVPAEEIFKDIQAKQWYNSSIEIVRTYGLMQGTSEDKFEPNRPINRAESATVMKNLLDVLESI